MFCRAVGNGALRQAKQRNRPTAEPIPDAVLLMQHLTPILMGGRYCVCCHDVVRSWCTMRGSAAVDPRSYGQTTYWPSSDFSPPPKPCWLLRVQCDGRMHVVAGVEIVTFFSGRLSDEETSHYLGVFRSCSDGGGLCCKCPGTRSPRRWAGRARRARRPRFRRHDVWGGWRQR